MMGSHKQRRRYFIDKKFQIRFVLNFIGIVFLASLVGMGIFLFFLKNSVTIAIEHAQVIVKTTADFILPAALATFLLALIFISLAAVVVTIVFSHRVSGPLFRLTKEVEALECGDFTRNFQTRGNDQLQIFARSLADMALSFRFRFAEIKDHKDKLKKLLEGGDFNLSADDKAKARESLKALDEKLNVFKTS